MIVGYARVSTPEQNIESQKDALMRAGCERLFEDIASGSNSKRPGLDLLLSFVRSGDIVVVYKLDRLARSLKHLIELINFFEKNEIQFRSITENIDTTTPSGKLFLHIFASLAEFERELIRERTIAGLRAAALRGRKGGRPRALNDKKMKQVQALHNANIPPREICKTLQISRATLYRALKSNFAELK